MSIGTKYQSNYLVAGSSRSFPQESKKNKNSYIW